MIQTTSVNGAETYARGGTNSDNGFSLSLESGAGEISWGMWQLTTTGSFDSVLVVQSIGGGSETWVALADFTENRWDVSGPYDNDIELPLDATDNNNGSGSMFIAVLAFDGNQAGVNDVTLRYDDGNLAPVAALTGEGMTEIEGDAPLAAMFDASGSADPDGTIADYEWDYDGDGFFNEPGIEADDRGIAQPGTVIYEAGPTFNVSVRVTDDLGAMDTASVPVTAHGWAVQTVDSEGSVGDSPTLAVVDGFPAICYREYINVGSNPLKYVRALDANGENWGAAMVLVDGEFFLDPSMLVVDGFPAVCYGEQASPEYDLKFLRALDAIGSSWAEPVEVDTSDSDPYYTSMQIVAGNPAIAYIDLGSLDAMYVRAQDASGGSWDTPIRLDIAAKASYGVSMAVVNGNPAMVYGSFPDDNTRYIRSIDTVGELWSPAVPVLGIGGGNEQPSLVVADGKPVVSVCDYESAVNLHFIRALDADGATWDSRQTIDPADGAGEQSSMAIVDGKPAVAYFESNLEILKYIQAEDAGGLAWGEPVVVDDAGFVGEYPSLIVVNGAPAIAYHDDDNNALKYARLY